MKLLAIDTATERCSVAISIDGNIVECSMDTARGHADLVLPMVEALLQQTQLTLVQLDGIAYGRGPGAFTGVRIAIGVVQGLAYGARLNTVGISDLAAMAQQVAQPGDRVLVCMDARMGEVYCGAFECDRHSGLVLATAPEQLMRPEQVAGQLTDRDRVNVVAGTGLHAYPPLAQAFAAAAQFPTLLPRARDVALLGAHELRAGRGQPALTVQPVYLRNQVAAVKRP